jgi:hypothetical protein
VIFGAHAEERKEKGEKESGRLGVIGDQLGCSVVDAKDKERYWKVVGNHRIKIFQKSKKFVAEPAFKAFKKLIVLVNWFMTEGITTLLFVVDESAKQLHFMKNSKAEVKTTFWL